MSRCVPLLALLLLYAPAALGGGKEHSQSIAIAPRKTATVFLRFDAEKEVELRVERAGAGNLNLHVFDLDAKAIASDVRAAKDCRVAFAPKKGLLYRVVIKNVGPAAERATLHHTGDAVQVVETKIAALPEGGRHAADVPLAAGKPAVLWVDCELDTDIDLYIYDADGRKVAWDARPGRACHVQFTPAEGKKYRAEIVNRGPGENRCKLCYTGEAPKK